MDNIYTQEVLDAFARENQYLKDMWIREAIKERDGYCKFIVGEDIYLDPPICIGGE